MEIHEKIATLVETGPLLKPGFGCIVALVLALDRNS